MPCPSTYCRTQCNCNDVHALHVSHTGPAHRQLVLSLADAVEFVVKLPEVYSSALGTLREVEPNKAPGPISLCYSAVVRAKALLVCVNCAIKVGPAHCFQVIIQLIWQVTLQQ